MNPLKIMEVSKVLKDYIPDFVKFMDYLETDFNKIAQAILGSDDMEAEHNNEFSPIPYKAGLILLEKVRDFKTASVKVFEAIEMLKPKG